MSQSLRSIDQVVKKEQIEQAMKANEATDLGNEIAYKILATHGKKKKKINLRNWEDGLNSHVGITKAVSINFDPVKYDFWSTIILKVEKRCKENNLLKYGVSWTPSGPILL